MSERRGKKRPKSYYRKSSHTKRQKLNSLSVGMRGFLITCNNNEKQAVREAYNILNEYADDLYGPEQLQEKKGGNSDESASEDEEEDMEKAMAKEVQALKEQKTERRFQNTDTNAKNCIFIRTMLEDPAELHHKIFSDLFEKKVSKSRFAIRMLPITGSCKAVLGEIKTLAENILPKYFPSRIGEERTYSVMFKVRNNNGVSRDSVLPLLGDIVKSLNPLNRVHCDNPDVAILVEIICSVCCMGVSTDYVKFRKYNLHEVVKDAVKLENDPEMKEQKMKEQSVEKSDAEKETHSEDGTEKETHTEVVDAAKSEKELEENEHSDAMETQSEKEGTESKAIVEESEQSAGAVSGTESKAIVEVSEQSEGTVSGTGSKPIVEVSEQSGGTVSQKTETTDNEKALPDS